MAIVDSLVSKSDFGSFAKAFTNNALHDSEISELMSYYAKLRAQGARKSLKGVTNEASTPKEDMESSAREVRLDITVLDSIFDKWFKDQEAVSGVLNVKVTRNKNIEFKRTIDSWKRREKERARHKKRHFERGKQLRAAFEKYQDYFDIDKEKVM